MDYGATFLGHNFGPGRPLTRRIADYLMSHVIGMRRETIGSNVTSAAKSERSAQIVACGPRCTLTEMEIRYMEISSVNSLD
jgi:hypothetical protein